MHRSIIRQITILVILFSWVVVPRCLAQTAKKVYGNVCSSDGLPMEKVCIQVTDSRMVVQKTLFTDEKGKFETALTASAYQIVAKKEGYKTAILRIKPNQELYSFVLNALSENLDEVVVTGYVNRNKESYTGSSFVIGKEVFQQQVNSNLLELIRNNTPGFEMVQNIDAGSDPNHVPDMILRGRSSFVENDNTNLPLFILDGVAVDVKTVFNLLPSTIERVSVLKDAAATAYYGSKAANGVVVITSLPTNAGRLQIDYDGRFQVSIADLSSYHLLNAAEKLEYERLAGIYGSFKGTSKTDIERQKVYYEKLDRVKAGANTNWMKIPLRTGFTHTHSLSLNGGTEKFRYRLTGGWQGVEGVMQKSSKDNLSLRVNLTYGDWSKLFFQYTARVESSRSDDVPYGSFGDYARLNPYDRPYNTDGTLNGELSFNTPNPIYEKSLNSYIKHRGATVSNDLKMRWNLGYGLRLESSLSYAVSKTDDETFHSPLSQRFLYTEKIKRGSFDVFHSRASDLSANLFLVWNKGFGRSGQHFVNLTLGGNLQSIEEDADGFKAVGVLSDKVDHVSMAAAFADGASPLGNRSRSRQLGSFLNAQYIYLNRYYVDASFRYEGSSKFGTSHRYAPFGMMGLGWNVHNEEFLGGSCFSLLKLRASVGVVGNVSFSPYQARLAYRYASDLIYNQEIGAMPVALVNPYLKWEKTTKRNAGIDFGLWNDRLSGSVEVYYNTTNDLVMTVAKPLHVGFSNGKENLGQIRNAGVEVSLRGKLIQSRHFMLNAYLVAAHNSNRIVKISEYLRNQNKRNAEQGGRLPVPLYAEGESLTALKVMKSAGINPANGKEIFIKRNGEQTYEYDYNERQTVGDLTPTVQGSGGFSASWKSLTLSVALSYRMGATVYNGTLAQKVEGASPLQNADRRVFYNRWQSPGNVSLYKGIAVQEATPPTSRFAGKEYALDGTSLMLAYELPPMLCRRLYVQSARVSLSTGNFFHLSTIDRERGLAYPFANVYELGINIRL